MAAIWPKRLPHSILNDSRRKAEVQVYHRFEEVLDDSFHVYYSSPWLGTDRYGNERDGECDFLVAHPEYGILAVEVKGGIEISFDPTDGQWRSRDHAGFVHRIKDPVAQARNAKYEILRRLDRSSHWRRRNIHAAHGVVFPGTAAPRGDLGADKPARLFCCARQLQDGFFAWIAERMKIGETPPNCEPLGKDGIQALERLLARPFTLSFRIGTAMAEANAEFRVLEPAQYQILDSISEISRVLIKGGAGTGKTVIASEAALRSAAAGRKTLLTCYNRPLAIELQRRLGDIPNLTVAGFHLLCGKLAKQAGIAIPTGIPEQQLYEQALPNALYEAAMAQPDRRWDTIIVDEGQDFRDEWWISLDACLRPDGLLRVFWDSNQKIYYSKEQGILDLSAIPVRLTRNLRNTKRIHQAAMTHYQGPDIIADGPEGVEVSWIAAESNEEKVFAAYQEFRRLVFKEDVSPGDIAVLVNDKDLLERFLTRASGLNIEFSKAEDIALENAVADTVRRFKGLERPAVILLIGRGEMEQRELAYVGFSRARAYLCVISSNAEARWLTGKG